MLFLNTALYCSMEEHRRQIERHCRVCGKRATTMKKDCKESKELLSEAFGIDILNDRESVHPPKFCNACNQRGKRIVKSKGNGTPYLCNFSPVTWTAHTEGDSCSVCERFRAGGRPRKVLSPQGRPGPLSPHTIQSVVKELAVRSLRSSSPLHPSSTGQSSRKLPCGAPGLPRWFLYREPCPQLPEGRTVYHK